MAPPDQRLVISSNSVPKYSAIVDNSLSISLSQLKSETDKNNGLIKNTEDNTSTSGKSDSSSNPDKISFWNLPRNKKFLLIVNMTAQFLMGCIISMVNPIFPNEAKEKMLSEMSISLVFGIFYAVIFLVSPLFGRYLASVGPNFTMMSGIVITGVSNILFGVLIFSPPGDTFFALCLVTRCFVAIGSCASMIASYAIVSNEFQDCMGMACGMLQSGSTLGFMFGPVFGGVVYEFGGYQLPIYLAGSLVLVNGIFMYIFLPKTDFTTNTEVKGSTFVLFKSPTLCVAVFSIFTGNMIIANIDATLTLHLHPLELSMGTIGLIFGVLDVSNVIATFLWSCISDRYKINKITIIVAHLVMALSIWLLGPSLFLADFIPLSMSSVCISLTIMGIIRGFHAISAIKCIFSGPEEIGLEYNINTLGLISGLLNASKTLGGFVGQFLVGVFQAEFSYPMGYTVEGLFSVLIMVIGIMVFTCQKHRANSKENYTDNNNKDRV